MVLILFTLHLTNTMVTIEEMEKISESSTQKNKWNTDKKKRTWGGKTEVTVYSKIGRDKSLLKTSGMVLKLFKRQ